MNTTKIAEALGGLKGIEKYVDLAPRLDRDHHAWLGDEKTTPVEFSACLRESLSLGIAEDHFVREEYQRRGELKVLKRLAGTDLSLDWNEVYARWQKKIVAKLEQLRDRANLCDREGISCPTHDTWARKVTELGDELELYAENPASQEAICARCELELGRALTGESDEIQARIQKLRQTASSNPEGASQDDAAALTKLDQASQALQRDDFIVAYKRICEAESILKDGRREGTLFGAPQRYPLRRRPDVGATRNKRPFEVLQKLTGKQDASDPRYRLLIPNEEIRRECHAPDGFVALHAQRSTEWATYFKVFREWLGVQGLSMKNLVPGNNFWTDRASENSGKATIVSTQPWRGAPFYEDREGRRRSLAIVRLSVTEKDQGRISTVKDAIGRSILTLFQNARASDTDEEIRFGNHGLAVVILPGEFFGPDNSYLSFAQQLHFEGDPSLKERVALLDEVDLLRIVPAGMNDRFRAFQELALPRFLSAHRRTYVESDPVAPKMFFGRDAELDKLDHQVTVVFSGRKMGKSSLLSEQLRRCGPDSDRRAVWVGCAGTVPWHSWRLLEDIAQQIVSLLEREGIAEGLYFEREQSILSGTSSDRSSQFHVIFERVTTRFRDFLAKATHKLQQRGVTRLFVLLDEADSFARAEMIESSGNSWQSRGSVSWFLRDRSQENGGFLRIIFAGFDELGRTENLSHSAFGNWGTRLSLEPLADDDSRRLITEPLAALGILVDEAIADRVHDYTSGHASLIQAFCARLIARISDQHSDWPLNDVEARFEDILFVGQTNEYQKTMAQTLHLNLGIARRYPLELVFCALASPTGLGCGKRMSLQRFTLDDALRQLEEPANNTEQRVNLAHAGLADHPDQVKETLRLLTQLGLLEERKEEDGSRSYRFRARHYVNYLRSSSDFDDLLRRSAEKWNRGECIEQIPRRVWTLPDEQLISLFDQDRKLGLVVGLENSGRDYLARTMLRQDQPTYPYGTDWEAAIREKLSDGAGTEKVVVLDSLDNVDWQKSSELLALAKNGQRPVRWIAGPKLAWEIAGDIEAFVAFEPIGMGPLTVAELDGWVARPMGEPLNNVPPGAAILEQAKPKLLEITGGLLPVLELMRRFYDNRLPEPVTVEVVEAFRENLRRQPQRVVKAARELARQIPEPLRQGLHSLFRVCAENYPHHELISRGDFQILPEMFADELREWTDPSDWQQLLDAALLLGFVRETPGGGPLLVPHASVLGMLVRSPEFLASP